MLGGSRTSFRSLSGLRDARNLSAARLQLRLSTCGLYTACAVINTFGAEDEPVDFRGIREQIRQNEGTGLSSIELVHFIGRNVVEDIAVLLERSVGEERLLDMLGRGEVICHVDGDHWIRLLSVIEDDGAIWMRIYDPARGNYEQLLTSLMTRSGSNNQMIWVRPPRR